MMRIGHSFIRLFLYGVVLTTLFSCVPKPSSDQVSFDDNSVGKIIIAESNQLGVFSVGEVHTVTLHLKNTGKFKVSFKPFILHQPQKIQFVGNEYPGIGGTCQTELSSGESCSLILQAFSSTIEDFAEPFGLEYLNGIGRASLEGNLTGYFGTPARIDMNLNIGGQSGIYDFGLVEPHVTRNYLLEIENKGNLKATSFLGFFDGGGGIFHFNGGFYPGINGTCTKTLNAGQKCILDIAATPVVGGVETKGSLKLNYSNPLSSKTFVLNLKVFSAEMKAYLSIQEKYQQIPDTINKAEDVNLPRVTWTIENVGLAPASAIALSSGDIPFTLETSTCPASLLPNEICTLTYKLNPQFNLPLPNGATFPISYNERDVQFSFLDSKNPLPVLSDPVQVNGKVIDEAQLVLYQDGNLSLPFPYVNDAVTGSGTWTREHWFAVIGDSNIPSKNLSIGNPGVGSRAKATSIGIEIIPNDGQLILDCLPNCGTSINPGSMINTSLRYIPVYEVPYEAQKNYQLKVRYHSGRREKEYVLHVQTQSKATPIISLRDESGVVINNGAGINIGKILPGKVLQSTVKIFNHGPFDFSPNVNLIDDGHNYFSLPSSPCMSATIKNGQSCDLIIQFQNNNTADVGFTFSQSINFDNGLDPSSPDYVHFSYSPYVELSKNGKLAASANSIDLGTLPWSTTGYPQVRNQYLPPAGISLIKLANTWDISKIDFEVLGPDASYFTAAPVNFTIPQLPDWTFSNGGVLVSLNSPFQVSGATRVLDAKLKISYYGRWRSDFISFFPEDVIEVDLNGSFSNAPNMIVTAAKQNYGPLGEGLQETGTITVKNIGQSSGNITGSFPTDSTFTITGMVQNGSCQQNSLGSDINFTIAANAECVLNVVFSPKGAGNQGATFRMSYTNSGGTPYSYSYDILAQGLNLARLIISPTNTNGNDLHEFGELRLGQSITKTFTLTQSISDSTPAQIVGISLLPFGAGCAAPTKVPATWEGSVFQSGDNIDFTVTSNTCVNGQNMATGDSCDISIRFQPQTMDKIIGTCLSVTYKQYPSSTTNVKIVQKLGGLGLAPNGIFNGWAGIFAEGQTESDPYKVKIQWKPMSVEDNLGTVAGYNIYRKKVKDTHYPSDPLNSSMIVTPANSDYFEYIDSMTEDRGSYFVPAEGDVYQYTVRPFLTISGIATPVLTTTTQVDRFVRVVIPFQNTVLVHRITSNILSCIQMLGKTYADLDRTKFYSCAYNGYGNSGNIFDAGKDRIIDRYENTKIGGVASNEPGFTPYLYSNLATAKESCTTQKGTVTDLVIVDRNKRLINRQDYMLASYNQQRAGCIDQSSTLEMSGRGQCKSIFGIEDLIGNAWDFIDAGLTAQSSPEQKWKIHSNLGIGDNRDWMFNIPVVDFEVANWSNPLTFTDRRAYSSAETKCIHPIFGIPMLDVAGVCFQGSQPFSLIENKMGLVADHFYLFTLGNTHTIFADYEGKRSMLAGGSYKSKGLYSIDINRYTIYWTEPEIESILYMGNPSNPWEGGAARCVLDLGY